MKDLYSLIMCVSMIILLVCGDLAYKKANSIAVNFARTAFSGFIATGASVIQLVTISKVTCSAAFSVFFVGTDFILLFLYRFVTDICFMRPKRDLIRKAMIIVVCVDSVSMLINPITNHMFDVYMLLYNRELYWQYSPTSLFFIHLTLVYVMSLMSIGVLVYKCFSTPHVYRVRYINIIIIITLTVGADVKHMIEWTPVDAMTMGFSVGCLVLFYYTLVFIPHVQTNHLIPLVTSNIMDTIILFDNEKNCIFKSGDNIENIFGKSMMEENGEYALFEKWCAEKKLSADEDFTHYMNIQPDTGDPASRQYYHIAYTIINDDNGKLLGSCINIIDRTEIERMIYTETYRNTHDELTGLFNREHFYRLAERYMRKHPADQLIIICSDVRNFKMINDVFGEEAGDRVMIGIADAIREHAVHGQVFGRLHDDHFVMIMKKEDFSEERFMDIMSMTAASHGNVRHPIIFYGGVYDITDRTIPVSVMCDRAMIAISSVKNELRSSIAYYDEDMHMMSNKSESLSKDIEAGFVDDEFYILLRPEEDAEGDICGAEVNVEWNHRRYGRMDKTDLMAALGENGEWDKIDKYVWRHACKTLKKWEKEGMRIIPLTVDISQKSFYLMDVFQEFLSLRDRYGIDPSYLVLRITEDALMENYPTNVIIADNLRSAGFRIQIDEFGNGYSSLNILKNVSVDSFRLVPTEGTEFIGSRRDIIILESIIRMTRDLDINVVVSGINSRADLEACREAGCGAFLGDAIGKSMNIKQFEEKYMAAV